MRAAFQVGRVLHQHWPRVEQHPHLNSWQLRTLGAVMRCRTAALGGHIDGCSNCGHLRISYNSCRNRHCPQCQGREREKWIEKREQELLPVPYFHVVFTLPDLLNPLALHSPRQVYDSLFEAAWKTLLTFGKDSKYLGARPGMIAILHTWGQTLSLHPHLHCIVPGGGLTKAGVWKTARSQGKYLFAVKAMSKVFRAKMLQALRDRGLQLDKLLVNRLYHKPWVVYCKRPFGRPAAVIEYLGRYTHKIAISNHRLVAVDEATVTFSYKDYRQEGKKQHMQLEALEFIRRFSLHILPKGLVRIRHYGILSSSSKQKTLPVIRQQVGQLRAGKVEPRQLEVYNPLLCPCCGQQTMMVLEVISRRGPPGRQVDGTIK